MKNKLEDTAMLDLINSSCFVNNVLLCAKLTKVLFKKCIIIYYFCKKSVILSIECQNNCPS